jgi:DNA-binding transcriptional LysR family regulator
VSFQIRALEERLGHRLLDRSGRRVRLTEAGEVVYRYARRMIGLEAELEREMGEIGTRVSGRLVLGSSTGPGEVLLPRLLGAFHAAHPEVKVSLVVSDTQTVCERVLDDELELGVVGAARAQRGLVFEPFVRDELVAIVPPGHPLAARGSVSLEELAAEPMLIQQEGSGVRSVVEGALRENGVRDRDLNVAMELGLQQSVKAAVLDGYGITVISRLAVERELADGSLVALALEGSGLERSFFAVRHAGRTPKRVTQTFVDFARAELGDMAAPASTS